MTPTTTARGRGWARKLLTAAVVSTAAAAAGTASADDPAGPRNLATLPPAGFQPVAAQIPGQTPPVGIPQTTPPGNTPAPRPLPNAGQPAAAQRQQQPAGLGPIRNPLLSATPATVGTTPVTSPATKQKLDRYVQKFIDPETTLDVVAGQTRVLVLKAVPFRVQIGDDKILSSTVSNPKEILLQGKDIGSTVLNLWFGDAADPAKQEQLTYLVRVYPDPEAKARLEQAYKKLEDEINDYFKDTSVRLKLVGDKVLVSGRVRDFVQGSQVLRIIRANVGEGGDVGRLPVAQAAATTDPNAPPGSPGLEAFQAAGGPNVINLLEVPGEQQVQLRVIVAEVNRSAARSIGMNFSVTNNKGVTVFSQNTGGLNGFGQGNFGGGGGGFGGGGGAAFGLSNITANFDSGKVPFAINALRTMEYARSLAEPVLTTLNGQPANFLAGGQFPVPVVTGNTFNGLQGVSYVPYGVQLSFTPFITDRDRIRLNVAATVSARDVGSGSVIGGSSVAGLTSRTFNTTIELRQGETMAVAGLVQTNLGGSSTRIPLFGDLPYVGAFFGYNRVEAGEKELVIFITPELARPLDCSQLPPLPGSEILDPSDSEFYLLTRLEGHCRDFRSPIRTDWSRLKQYHLLESTYISGPSGYSNWPGCCP